MKTGNVSNREYVYQSNVKENKPDDFTIQRKINEGGKTIIVFERTANTFKNRALRALGLLKNARLVNIHRHFESLGASSKTAQTMALKSVKSENSNTIRADFFENNINKLKNENPT
jgi:hypothetical protein